MASVTVDVWVIYSVNVVIPLNVFSDDIAPGGGQS